MLKVETNIGLTNIVCGTTTRHMLLCCIISHFISLDILFQVTHFITCKWWFILQVIDEYGKYVHYVEIDIEEDPEIAEAAGIMGTPCVQFFKNKEMLRFVIIT